MMFSWSTVDQLVPKRGQTNLNETQTLVSSQVSIIPLSLEGRYLFCQLLISFAKFLVAFLHFVVVSGIWVDLQNILPCI